MIRRHKEEGIPCGNETKGWDGKFDDDAWLEQSLLRTIRDEEGGEGRGFT